MQTKHLYLGSRRWSAIVKNTEKTGSPLFSSHMLDLSGEEIDFNLLSVRECLNEWLPSE